MSSLTDPKKGESAPKSVSYPRAVPKPTEGAPVSAPSDSSKSGPKKPKSEILRRLGQFLTYALIAFGKSIYYTIRFSIRYLIYHPAHALFSACLLVLLAVLVAMGANMHQDMILGEISEATIERLIEASKYTRAHNSTRLSSRGTLEFLDVGGPEWVQREGIRAILFEARRAGLPIEDQAVLLATAEVESGFNPMAKAPTTTACGLFQFVRATGKMYGLAPADCMNPFLNAAAGVAHYKTNMSKLVSGKIDGLEGPQRVFRSFELSYYIHHDGPNSTKTSDMVKAVVLDGTSFLFEAYAVLLEEERSKMHAPSFSERLTEKLLETLDSISERLSLISRVEAERTEA